MDLITIINRIDLQKELKKEVIDLVFKYQSEYDEFALKLTDASIAEDTFVKLAEKYQDDKLNMNVLAVYMLACLETHKKYQKLGIDDKVFIDTMKCFTRFIDECLMKNGVCYFDRGFWTHRQTSLKLFRIGELEYELVVQDGEKFVSIHIPSDAILTKELIQKSIDECKEFISKYYPTYNKAKYVCGTWLLSPNLRKYLKEGSRILQFQNFFEIINFNEDSKDFMDWLFMKDQNSSIESLPENTSLQKNVKKALLEGKKIGSAFAVLKI